jgi:hypothetical protein
MLRYRDRADVGYLEVEEGWKGLSREPLTPSRIGRYEGRLTPRQIWTVDRVLGPLLTQHGYERNSPDPGPIQWRSGYWVERIGQRVLRSMGIYRPLLDEQAVLARRDELFEKKRAAGEGPDAPARPDGRSPGHVPPGTDAKRQLPDTLTAGRRCR